MAQVQQRLLALLVFAGFLAIWTGATVPAFGRKFYPDDPLLQEPRPLPVENAKPRKLSDLYDLVSHIFVDLGERQLPAHPIVARDINTLGEVPAGPWYESRLGRRPMTSAELAIGPNKSGPPATDGKWLVISAKSEGVTPGFLIQDQKGTRFFIKFDPLTNPEMATAADVISSKFFYALGYHVPENYIVSVDRSRLEVRKGATFRDATGKQKPLTSQDVEEILMRTPRDADGRSRATASRLIEGDILHPYRYYGTRADDPNDVVRHEHRRSLRGLFVFCAWLGHDDSRAINSIDVLANENGGKYVKHYLLDFGSTLGSASTHANSPRSGFEQFFTWRSSAKEFFSFGLYTPAWSRVKYPDLPSVGRFTAAAFNPETWTPEYPNPAFLNRQPGDTFWAAKQIALFSDDDIRAIVHSGGYSDPEAESYVSKVLMERRDIITKTYLSQPLGLDRLAVRDGRVAFEDWAVLKGFQKDVPYQFVWSTFDNEKEVLTPISGARDSGIPSSDAAYLALEITASSAPNRKVTVYLRKGGNGYAIIGIDRAWN